MTPLDTDWMEGVPVAPDQYLLHQFFHHVQLEEEENAILQSDILMRYVPIPTKFLQTYCKIITNMQILYNMFEQHFYSVLSYRHRVTAELQDL